GERLRAISHSKRILATAWITLNRARHNARANLDSDIAKCGVCCELRRQLRRRQVIHTRLLDRARHQVARWTEHQQAAEEKLGSCFHLPHTVRQGPLFRAPLAGE